MITSAQQFREMTQKERSLVDRLLEFPFPGRDALTEQLHDSLVRPFGDNGSLDFQVRRGVRADVNDPIPVEGAAEDVDGTTIHILLHVIDGTARDLEVYKNDSSRVIKMPEPPELRLFSPP